MAQAAHDNVVSLASAADNYAHDGSSTNYNNAVNAAATALANARSAAATQYQDGTVATTGADGIGVATATQETNDAGALLTDAQTVAGDDLADAQSADLEIDTYSKAESDAYDLQTKNDATALDTLIKGDADSLKAKAATADTSSPSSWMDQWAAQTSADDTKEDADADAALAATNSTADALDLKERNEADAQQKKDDGDAQAVHDKAVNDAQATHDQSISDAGNITSAIAKDAYFATLPDVYPAFTWDPSVNPALLDASHDEVYAVDDLALPLTAGQDDGSSPLPPGDVIGAGVMAGSPDPATGGPAPILGQSFSLGATTDPYDGIALSATPMVTTLLNDNGVYDPGNPYSSFSGWAGFPWLTGETPVTPTSNPGSGNPPMLPGPTGAPPPGQPGGGGQQNPSSPPGQPAPLVPPTNPEAPGLLGNYLGRNSGRMDGFKSNRKSGAELVGFGPPPKFPQQQVEYNQRLGGPPTGGRPLTWSETLDRFQTVVGGFGMIPGLGEPADALNLVISLARRDWKGAGLSALSLLPIGGQAPGAANLARFANRAADAKDLTRLHPRAGVMKFGDDAADAADKLSDAGNTARKAEDKVADAVSIGD